MLSNTRKINEIRKRLGDRLTILAHHYQMEEVVQHADCAGDSLELARKIPGSSAENIVFCGVHFMAETAAILSSERQRVFIPDMDAGCVMANMAPAGRVRAVLDRLRAGGKKVVPLAYVNTSAEVKALCGEYDGSVCTSANARTMMKWALERGDGVLFLPDKNLAMNTADHLGIPEERRMPLKVGQLGEGVEPADADKADLFIWPGMCVIHHRFKTVQVERVRREDPDALIVVHPECDPEVVTLADANGSTSFIIRYVNEAPAGARIYIGTEANLVFRLAERFKGEKTIIPLVESYCSNMGKISEENLLRALETFDKDLEVTVDEVVAESARVALERMLEACK